jgi:hypothetical protein
VDEAFSEEKKFKRLDGRLKNNLMSGGWRKKKKTKNNARGKKMNIKTISWAGSRCEALVLRSEVWVDDGETMGNSRGVNLKSI